MAKVHKIKEDDTEEHFLVRILKSFFPQIVYYVVGAIISIVVLRTDVAALSNRVDALDAQAANKDVVAEQFIALNNKVDRGFKDTSDSIKEVKSLLYRQLGLQ